jgi:hypothetical protein
MDPIVSVALSRRSMQGLKYVPIAPPEMLRVHVLPQLSSELLLYELLLLPSLLPMAHELSPEQSAAILIPGRRERSELVIWSRLRGRIASHESARCHDQCTQTFARRVVRQGCRACLMPQLECT